jgi:hypothetical protein
MKPLGGHVHGNFRAKAPAISSNYLEFPRLGCRGNLRVLGLCPNMLYTIFAILHPFLEAHVSYSTSTDESALSMALDQQMCSFIQK